MADEKYFFHRKPSLSCKTAGKRYRIHIETENGCCAAEQIADSIGIKKSATAILVAFADKGG